MHPRVLDDGPIVEHNSQCSTCRSEYDVHLAAQAVIVDEQPRVKLCDEVQPPTLDNACTRCRVGC
jgi:hypothetical protein